MSVEVERALEIVKAAGYVALREKSYRQAQERQRRADALRAAAERHEDSEHEWAIKCCDEERRIRDRLTFVYGVAREHGATVEELAGATGFGTDGAP